MAAKTVAVKHPVIEGVVYEVPTDKVSDWKAAGWKSATKAELAEVDAPE